MKNILPIIPREPSWRISAIPLVALAITFILIIVFAGPLTVTDYAPLALLGCAALTIGLALWQRSLTRRSVVVGLRRSALQLLPAIPMLICIAALATTWMLSGVVPTLIEYGLLLLSPTWFLVTACVVCAMVSVLTGSSWSTIATIGVAFMGIGSAMGYAPGWTAGAIISGAYFGDKVSPLSDTTVIASSTCGVDLFAHIRYLMITTVPAMSVTLIVFGLKGLLSGAAPLGPAVDVLSGLNEAYNISLWTLVIPVVTLSLIACRVNTLLVLAVSALLGAVGIVVFQPQHAMGILDILRETWSGHTASTGHEMLDSLTSTGGILGILPVVILVSSALVFGASMIASGMLASVAHALTNGIRRPASVIATTLGSGIVLNCITADQYLSIIISGNMSRSMFRRCRMESRLQSRTLEDGVSVTSPLIPWNSCGITQSTVLGVPTLVYLPYCVFNYLTPVFSLLVVSLGFKIHRAVTRPLAQ